MIQDDPVLEIRNSRIKHISTLSLSLIVLFVIGLVAACSPSDFKFQRSQSVKIIVPPLDEQGWHSPSFGREAKRLTFVSNCNRKTCPAAAKGSHIAVLDIKIKKFSQITDSEQEIDALSYSFSRSEPYRLFVPGYSEKVVRGTPAFSSDDERIYYMAANRLGSEIFW